MPYTDLIDEIENLPHYREYTCKVCGARQKVFILTFQTACTQCGAISWQRSRTKRHEIEDLIDAVLEWIGSDEILALALQRKREIDEKDDID